MTAGLLDTRSEHLLRELAPQVLGAVVRRFGDFAAAEDAVQEALIAASLRWPQDGVPDYPRAWLIQVASRRMLDYLRSETARRLRETAAAMEMEHLAPAADVESATQQDDTVVLLFMCCHPALTPSSAIALTLRAVGGLTTAEIANAFLVPESTMAQRISQALSRGSVGSYQLQAAIAAVHDEATRAEETDWPQIVVLYSLLKRMSDNPMVTLNHAIAAAMVHGPATGLELLDALDADARMAGHYRLDAVRAHLFEMAGDHLSAIAHYRAAARRTTSIPERDYLTTQAARLAS